MKRARSPLRPEVLRNQAVFLVPHVYYVKILFVFASYAEAYALKVVQFTKYLRMNSAAKPDETFCRMVLTIRKKSNII